MVIFLALALAQSLPLQITEIMYNLPGGDDGYEWVEVKNVSSQTLSLKSQRSGWRFYDGKNHLFKNDLTIQPNEIFVIVQDANLFQEKYPNFSGKLVEVSFSLKNSAGEIKILDEKENLLAYAEYQDSFGADGNGYTLVFDGKKFIEGKIKGGTPGEENLQNQQETNNIEKEPNTNSTFNEETKTSSTTKDNTETQENLPEQNQTSNQIKDNETNEEIPNEEIQNIIAGKLESIKKKILWQNLFLNEFLPNPEGKDSENEFIEIYNANQEKVNLDGLILIVGEKAIPLSGEIDANSFFVFTRKDYHFIIKNNGEKISLQTIDGKLIHQISFSETAPEGVSFARFSNGWQWTLPTPGKENQLIELKEENQKDLQKLNLENNIPNDEGYQIRVQELTAKTDSTNQPGRNYLFEFILPLLGLVTLASFIFWKYLL